MWYEPGQLSVAVSDRVSIAQGRMKKLAVLCSLSPIGAQMSNQESQLKLLGYRRQNHGRHTGRGVIETTVLVARFECAMMLLAGTAGCLAYFSQP